MTMELPGATSSAPKLVPERPQGAYDEAEQRAATCCLHEEFRGAEGEVGEEFMRNCSAAGAGRRVLRRR